MMDGRLFGMVGMVARGRARQRSRLIKFEIRTTTPLPVGDQVFVCGNQEGLGDWKPEGLPLTRLSDDLWAGMAVCSAGEPLEFKITRGAWETEEVGDDGAVPSNHRLEPGGDFVVQHTVARWKDRFAGPAPKIAGDFRVHPGIHSAHLRFDRTVIVWLPPSYAQQPERRYPVCYLQDGQQVFDPRTSTWNQDWEVDEWCTLLMTAGEMREIIAVAVYSTEDRELEYNPSLAGASYARFLIEELKPWVDREYRTEPGAVSTAVAGASLGGTLAFYLAWTRPDVFSAAACLSPAFRLREDCCCLDLVKTSADIPDVRLFLYCGLGDPTERELAEGVAEMATLLKQRGYEPGRRLAVVEDREGRHEEAAWARHTGEWLRFLYGCEGSP
jgi:predicted alpha/beta superfamily hydrolase